MNKYKVILNMKSGMSIPLIFESDFELEQDVSCGLITRSNPYFTVKQSHKTAITIKTSEIESVQVTAIL